MYLYICIQLPTNMSCNKRPFSLLAVWCIFHNVLAISIVFHKYSVFSWKMGWVRWMCHCIEVCSWVIKKSKKTQKRLETLLKQEILQILSCASSLWWIKLLKDSFDTFNAVFPIQTKHIKHIKSQDPLSYFCKSVCLIMYILFLFFQNTLYWYILFIKIRCLRFKKIIFESTLSEYLRTGFEVPL